MFFSLHANSKDINIYVMDIDGKNLRRLTHTSTSERTGFWSLDGKRLAFASDRDGPSRILVINADGSGLVQLTGNLK